MMRDIVKSKVRDCPGVKTDDRAGCLMVWFQTPSDAKKFVDKLEEGFDEKIPKGLLVRSGCQLTVNSMIIQSAPTMREAEVFDIQSGQRLAG